VTPGPPGPRHRIHADVRAKGYDPARDTFVQYYGSVDLDLVNTARNLTAHGGPAEHRPAG